MIVPATVIVTVPGMAVSGVSNVNMCASSSKIKYYSNSVPSSLV